MRVHLLALFALKGVWILAVSALSVPATHVVHERRDLSSPHNSRWIKRERVPAQSRLPVRIGLSQSNLDAAHDHLMRISDPSSPDYGRHWSPAEVVDFFQPSEQAVEQVTRWLRENGVSRVTHSDNKGWLAFDAPASMVEALLHAEYFEHHDSVTGGVMPACDAYHVPKAIQRHIDYITPGIKLMAPLEAEAQGVMKHRIKRRSFLQMPASDIPPTANVLDNCENLVTPECIATLYNIPPGRKSDSSNALGMFQTNLQVWDQADLDLFFTKYAQEIPQGTHPTDNLIDGGIAETSNASSIGGNAEALLDLQVAYPIVWPQNITVYDVDDIRLQSYFNSTWTYGFNTFLDAIDGSYCTYTAYNETGDLVGVDPSYPDPSPDGYDGTLQCGTFEPTNVISLSYGGTEAAVPIAYQKRQCNEYMKLGLQGITLVFASGDDGVAERLAFTDDTASCIGPDDRIFNPSWPSTCPYVTSVGATYIPPGSTVYDPEAAAIMGDNPDYTSGGGFSNVHGTADYQRDATEKYFSEHDPAYAYYSGLVADADNPALPDVEALAGETGGRYNRIGRGYPDVSANGNNIAIYLNGGLATVSGSSASTPIFASIINRINEERIAIGKKPVGFINPALYANPQMFNDITSGNNTGCNDGGFDAVDGWDPVTGLGTPDYTKMLDVFLDLP